MATKSPPEASSGAEPAVDPNAAAAPPSDRGGVFVNTGATDLVLISPPGGTVRPGRVITLPYTPSHRDLRAATPAEVKASADAEAAEAEAARPTVEQTAANTGQEA